jgi:transcriptional regulator with XRE-family HTH domain
MTKEAREQSEIEFQKMKEDILLYELREARKLSQQQIANLLHTSQPNISKIEKRTDLYVSTLRSYIEAMGGELKVIAKFPEGEINIRQFSDTGHPNI